VSGRWRALPHEVIAARPLAIGYVIQRERYGRLPEVLAHSLSWTQACKLLAELPADWVMRIAGTPRKAYKRTAQRAEPHAQTEREAPSEA
jgi:hypothetical protein